MNFIAFFQTIILSGGATTIATQILKSDFIPVQFQEYPRLTALVVAIIASGIAVWQAGIDLHSIHGWTSWAAIAVGTLVTAAVAYNNLLKPTSPNDTLR